MASDIGNQKNLFMSWNLFKECLITLWAISKYIYTEKYILYLLFIFTNIFII